MSFDCPMKMFLSVILLRDIFIFLLFLILIVVGFLIGLKFRQKLQKRRRLNNIQRISNLQLISTCESEFGHDNATYNSNMDFAYLPSYIPIYGSVLNPQNDVCSCHLKVTNFKYCNKIFCL